MKVCPKCYEENPSDAKFCRQCKADLEQTAGTCPAGLHTMDPSWTECAYCKAEGVVSGASSAGARPARRETVVESAEPAGRRVTVAENDSAPYTPQPTFDDPLQSPSSRQKTRFSPAGVPGNAARGATTPERTQTAAVARKIVGVLITYTWHSDGQIFPVREGRNLIGRDAEKCDIAIPEDDTLSGINSHITFRKNFVIGDNVSMSGTDVNGEPVEQQFQPLDNYATIRTGSTHWTFIAINPEKKPS